MEFALYLVCVTVGAILGVASCLYIDQVCSRKS